LNFNLSCLVGWRPCRSKVNSIQGLRPNVLSFYLTYLYLFLRLCHAIWHCMLWPSKRSSASNHKIIQYSHSLGCLSSSWLSMPYGCEMSSNSWEFWVCWSFNCCVIVPKTSTSCSISPCALGSRRHPTASDKDGSCHAERLRCINKLYCK
jgi:hypothetical protein